MTVEQVILAILGFLVTVNTAMLSAFLRKVDKAFDTLARHDTRLDNMDKRCAERKADNLSVFAGIEKPLSTLELHAEKAVNTANDASNRLTAIEMLLRYQRDDPPSQKL